MKNFLNINYGLIFINSKKIITKCNSAFEKISGYKREELEDKLSINDIFEDLNPFEEKQFYTLLKRKNGEVIDILVNVLPFNEDLSVIFLSDFDECTLLNKINIPLIGLDVSELLRYFQTLRKIVGKELYKYFYIYPEMIYEIANKIKIINVNSAFLKEYADFDLKNFQENLFTYLTEESIDVIKREITKFYNDNLDLDFEIEVYTVSKKVRKLSINVLFCEKERVLVSVVDITQQRNIEKMFYDSLYKFNDIFNQVILTLSSIIEFKDSYTAYHQKRVSELSQEIAREMNLSHDKIEAIKIGALLHDIGKISIPGEILNKPAKLNPLEMNIVRTHPINGYSMLKNIDFPSEVLEIVAMHHERLDGSGYPEGLKDEKIPLHVRIVSVADVLEAMVSHRPYRPSLGIDKALKEIEDNKGIKYDEKVVDICIKLFREKGFKFSL